MVFITRPLLFLLVSCIFLFSCRDNITVELLQTIQSLGLQRTTSSTLSSIPVASKRLYSGVLPSSRMLTMPPVANQGTMGSCAAFAAAYTNRSFQSGQSFYDQY
jgi:hypothetical protein